MLTGFSQNSNFIPYFVLGDNFVSANTIAVLAKYPAGYLAAGSVSGAQTCFFAPGQFDPSVLRVAASTGQPVTVGELLTLGGPSSTKNAFQGPVFVVTGGETRRTLTVDIEMLTPRYRARHPFLWRELPPGQLIHTCKGEEILHKPKLF